MVDTSQEKSSLKDESEQSTESMLDWLNEEYLYCQPKRGDLRKATILEVKPSEVLVDIGAKMNGVVQDRDLVRLDEEVRAALKPGAEIMVYVLQPESEGEVIVSINMAQSMRDWQRAMEYLESQAILESEVVGYNRGGLLMQFGQIQGFVPTSQVSSLGRGSRSPDRDGALQEMVGRTLPVKVIEVDHRRRRLILSERQARREWEKAQREQFIAELQEGQTRHGVVSSLCDFGAFVSLGYIDGLIHISEISWERVNKPEQVLQVGQEVDVYVLSVDRERERIALSLKRLQSDPWSQAVEKYWEGQLVEGEITNVLKFGAFASIGDGIEGLIHISELADEVSDPAQIVQIGDRVQLRVLEVDKERRRIALSLKRAND
ncbi:MAG: S1 RNA-binding domain-containing protein [Chloroflexi bacterium]|nr:S1 RNA-binding domain-containing protein [Chloroflexota bacterium]